MGREKAYVDGTTLQQILDDGWSRGFLPQQTLEEAEAQGFSLSAEELTAAWKVWDDKLSKDMEVWNAT